ncbi:hypothetical protein ES705_48956 [subsurface metagenome]
MGLRWNTEQVAIHDMLLTGLPNKEIKAKGYSSELIKKVKKAINKGDAPPEGTRGEKGASVRRAAFQCHSQNDQGNTGPDSGCTLRLSAACPEPG